MMGPPVPPVSRVGTPQEQRGNASGAIGNANTAPIAGTGRTAEGPFSYFMNSDGDRAEISGMAMNMNRGNRFGIDFNMNLPSPFIDYAQFRLNPNDPLDLRNWGPESAPPTVVMPYSPPTGVAPPVGDIPGIQMPGSEPAVVDLEALKPPGECKTCESRRYVDQSDDASVSFQTPTHISPNMSAAAVASHENEHVSNERSRADREGREIISQSVSLTYDCCPECGRNYVSGGTTRTTSISKSDDDSGFNGEDSPDGEAKTPQSL